MVVTPLVAGAVAVAVNLLFRWHDRTVVRWVAVGEAHAALNERGQADPKRVVLNLTLHNVGDGTAHEVTTRRRNGPQYFAWLEFEAAHVRPGESISLTATTGDWESFELDLFWSDSPTSSIRGRWSRRHRKGQPALRKGLRLSPPQHWTNDGAIGKPRPRLPHPEELTSLSASREREGVEPL